MPTNFTKEGRTCTVTYKIQVHMIRPAVFIDFITLWIRQTFGMIVMVVTAELPRNLGKFNFILASSDTNAHTLAMRYA
ncbi:hypothetical protein BD410DRAFT_554453 [Rickenella mellea]|uniref:Uncharacterized protein n=1 Tax=Rickenella mellea TaxID=50990 RepID=A0A4Y7PQM4_9AGAM|nr:hypothetical protein BD410DRAFT_554453 [Rickenella mellea]